MLETLRERLLSVQQDFTSGLKTLSDKSREAKVKSKPRYEDTWAALHRRAKECASAGELVDSEVVMLSAHWEKKKTSLVELQEQLQQLPALIADLESVTANLTHLEASFEEVENNLLHLEDLCGQCELERCKHMQSQQLENYKKNKRKELETFKAELDAEHAQKVLEMEHTQQMKLKERQKFFEEAFQQDMEQYLSTGYLQIAERREPIGSMSSMEVNVDMLEQMDLMDISDQEALDVFLNSGEENTVPSPALGRGLNPVPIRMRLPSRFQIPQNYEPSHLPLPPPAPTWPPRTSVRVGSPPWFSLMRRKFRWTLPWPRHTLTERPLRMVVMTATLKLGRDVGVVWPHWNPVLAVCRIPPGDPGCFIEGLGF
ncbi:PREDICTED: dysbindin isoform X4 [Mandrillus leucophaeus]|uniref:dysbindin isoform X4 n=1 Tax=Mandrillus leucophaeus TaxID=9568 RepID=UPI0005F4AB54|nr:PREDICTED: dysbindin isoform X4 [Mandrillus leucophaeus]